MAFDFPNDPVDGQKFVTEGGPVYVWNDPVWEILPASFDISATVPFYESRSDAQASAVPITSQSIILTGFASGGDGGEAIYRRVVDEPVHPGKLKSLDGAWWELSEELPNTAMFQDAETAILYCTMTNKDLFWPEHDYPLSDTVPGFHEVRHRGKGRVLRGANTFHVEPRDLNFNYIHVATTGNDANDGLTPDKAVLTGQRAFDILARYPRPLRGTWEIRYAAGTYTKASLLDEGLTSINPIRIIGASVNRAVPTTIIDGTTETINTGFYFKRYSHIFMKDIRVRNFRQGGFAYGILSYEYSYLSCENVDVVNCTYGIGSRSHTSLLYKYGRVVSCGTGILSLDFSLITIGYGGSTVTPGPASVTFAVTDGSYVGDCDIGVYATENGQGHVDYTRLFDNRTGIFMAYGSRLNVAGSHVYNNTVAGIDYGVGAWAVCGSSVFTGNAINHRMGAYSGPVDTPFGDFLQVGQTAFLGRSTSSIAAPGTIGSYLQHVNSFAVLPGMALKDTKTRLRVRCVGSVNKGAGTGRTMGFRLYAGGQYIAAASIGDTGAAAGNILVEFEVFGIAAASQKYMGSVRAGSTRQTYFSEMFYGTTAVNLNTSFGMDIYTLRENAADTLTWEIVSAELYGSAG